jgi:hypothetical protein
MALLQDQLLHLLRLAGSQASVIGLRRDLLDVPEEQRAAELAQAALAWVESEERRVVTMTQLVRLDPLFGPPTFLPDPGLCFVITPFS